jgi:thiamine biosynthesis lipoprotein
VAVQDPDKRGDFPDLVHLKNGAVATSGSYEIYLDRERAFHHIIDSCTGRSPSRNASVTVVAPSTMVADALATAAFVMGPEEGVAFIDSFSRCECLIIDAHGCQMKSKRWKSAANPT